MCRRDDLGSTASAFLLQLVLSPAVQVNSTIVGNDDAHVLMAHANSHRDIPDLRSPLIRTARHHVIPTFLPPVLHFRSPNPFHASPLVRSTRGSCKRHFRGLRMSDKPITKPIVVTTMPSNTTFLYFCYGSNMLRSKLSNRGPPSTPPISFTDVFKARLTDWKLCFDQRGAPPQEPAMATIQPEQGDVVYGIVYRMSSTICWEKLLRSEGVTKPHGPYDSYHVVPVTVECLVDETYVEMSAMTLLGNPRYTLRGWMQPLVRPSRRYVDILIDGATQECLPNEYVERLKNTPVARQWKPSILLYIMIISIPLMFLSRRRTSARFLTYPLSNASFWLYAKHEHMETHPEGWSISRGVGIMMCKLALFLLYSVYAIPSLILAVCSPMGRYVLLLLGQKPAVFESRKQS